MSYKNKAILCSLLDQVINNGQFDQLPAIVSQGVVADMPARAEPITGIQEFAEVLMELRDAFPDLATVIEGGRILHEHDSHIVGKGLATDRVAAHVVLRGTHLGKPYMGIPASGREAVWSEAYFARVEADLIVEFTVVADRLGMYRQLGVSAGAAFDSAPENHPRQAV